MFDLGPAAQEMSRLVAGVQDDQLSGPTPCSTWTVTDLLAHVQQFTSVFTDNARKLDAHPPASLPGNWRVTLPTELHELAQVWREESAWRGRTSAGGIEMAAADNAVVAIEELVVHSWDLAQATRQKVRVEEGSLDQVDRFFALFGPAANADGGPFGPSVTAPENPTRLEATIARTGRNPRGAVGH